LGAPLLHESPDLVDDGQRLEERRLADRRRHFEPRPVGHDDAAARLLLHQAQAVEDPKRLTDGATADPQRLGELQLDGERVARLEIAGADEASDLVGSLGDDAFPIDSNRHVGLFDIRTARHSATICDRRRTMSSGLRWSDTVASLTRPRQLTDHFARESTRPRGTPRAPWPCETLRRGRTSSAARPRLTTTVEARIIAASRTRRRNRRHIERSGAGHDFRHAEHRGGARMVARWSGGHRGRRRARAPRPFRDNRAQGLATGIESVPVHRRGSARDPERRDVRLPMMAPQITDDIRNIRERWHTKQHPFFQALAEGKLPLRALGVYKAMHWQFLHQALASFGIFYARTYQYADVRKAVVENLSEEEGLKAIPRDGHQPHDHSELIFRFCRAAGLSADDVRATKMTPAWWGRALHYYHTTAHEPIGVVLAMQSTQEGQQPALNKEVVLPALAKHYNLPAGSPPIPYFPEHADARSQHTNPQAP